MGNNKKVFARIITLELVGFLAVILCLWLVEIIELPHLLLGEPATPINWEEASIETLVLVTFGAIVIFQTKRLIKKINYLEGFLQVCSFCRKINIDDKWIPLETYIKQRTEAQISHSFCPDCYQEHFSQYEKEDDSSGLP